MARKKNEPYDFQGWATAYNVECADGRVLMPGAFDDCDGSRVTLVYQHNHGDINAVLGHADLECRPEGVYAYCTLADTESGRNARTLINGGSIRSLSINANNLVQNGKAVVHGIIRELSLVLAGANPKATIEFPELTHGAIWNPDDASEIIAHTVMLNGDDLGTEGGKSMAYQRKDADWLQHDDDGSSETIGDAFNRVMSELDEDQRAPIEAMIGAISEASEDPDDDDEYDEEGVEHGMPYNIFDGYGGDELSHGELMGELIGSAINEYDGSFKSAMIAHGIDNVELLFPEAHNLTPREPALLDRDQSWVDVFLNACEKVPFFNIKATMANITEERARALGYITGNRKKDQVFKVLRRKTSAQTVYVRDKYDRDDLLEVTEFDLAAYTQRNMRTKLREELARAALIGDGRAADSEDKIREENVRPIWKDDDLFTIKATVAITAADTINTQCKEVIRTAVLARSRYRGQGRPILFIDPASLSHMLLIEDLNGRRIYDSEASLAAAMRVSRIVEVPLLENVFDSDDTSTRKMLAGIIVNPADYTLGCGKGGEVTTFSDFDINFNQYTYLIETRMCGTLTEAYRAIALFYPAGVTPKWYTADGTMNYTRDFESALGDTASPTITYYVANPVAGDNPRLNGWFERSGTDPNYVYAETTDTAPAENKTYYVRRVTRNITGHSVG